MFKKSRKWRNYSRLNFSLLFQHLWSMTRKWSKNALQLKLRINKSQSKCCIKKLENLLNEIYFSKFTLHKSENFRLFFFLLCFFIRWCWIVCEIKIKFKTLQYCIEEFTKRLSDFLPFSSIPFSIHANWEWNKNEKTVGERMWSSRKSLFEFSIHFGETGGEASWDIYHLMKI